MSKDIIHALVLIQNWGDDDEILGFMKGNPHIISIFHVMGRHSYLIDANFDNKEQLTSWVSQVKSAHLPSGVPAVLSLQTQRIIDVPKQKESFTLQGYLNMKERFHFFVQIDNPHHDEELLDLLKSSPIVHSILHVQGENSFTIEVIVEEYDQYRQLLKKMKTLQTIHHIETQEVISVIKYRNHVLDESGDTRRQSDSRELYTL